MDIPQRIPRPNPISQANFFARHFLVWFWPIFRLGSQKPLRVDDLWDPAPEDQAKENVEKLESAWKRRNNINNYKLASSAQITNGKGHVEVLFDLGSRSTQKCQKYKALVMALVDTFGFQYFSVWPLIILADCGLKVVQPWFLLLLVRSFIVEPRDEAAQYLWAAGVSISTLLITLINNPCLFYLGRVSQRCRISLSSLVQRKVLRLSASTPQTDQGQITNLISNDAAVIEEGLMVIPNLLVAPLQLILFTGFLYVEFGWSIAPGMAFILIFMAFQYVNGTKSTKYRKKIGAKTDERIGLLAEVIDAIQTVKMYTWEWIFHDILQKRRKEEVKQIRKRSSLYAFQISIFYTSSRFVPFLTFAAAVCLLGIPLTADRVFYAVAALKTLTHHMGFMLPAAIRSLGEMKGSLQRLQRYLQLSEKPDNHDKYSVESSTKDIPGISLKMVSASWNLDYPSSPVLSNLNCGLEGNKLVMVVGKVGCGKTSFLNLLLNELHIKKCGQVRVSGTLSYAPQEPNLFPGSIRANILNGRPFIARAYKKCLEAACLTQDISGFKGTGDSKRVSGLSGGQKARVNLARALYHKYIHNANIFLLDDPLSALDAGVSRRIFEGTILGELKNTLRIFATHHVQYLREADHVIVIDGGKIVAQGKHSDSEVESKVVELLGTHTDANVDALMVAGENNPQRALTLPKSCMNTSAAVHDDDGEKDKEEEEEQGVGSLGLKIYWKYFDAGNSRFQLFIYFLAFLISQVFITLTEWWLALWTNAEERILEGKAFSYNHTVPKTNSTITLEESDDNFLKSLDNLEQHWYVYVYLILTSIVFFTNLAKAFGFFSYSIRISTRIHEKMLTSLLRAKPSFFEKNTQGRIMNRFTKDIKTIDEQIPLSIFEMWAMFLQVCTVILLIVVAIWYSVVLVIVFLLSLRYVRGYYVSTSRDLKRIDGTTRSPVISHVQASFSALTTMRALGAEKNLCGQFDSLQDLNTSSTISFLAASQCFNIWVEILATILLTLVTFGFLFAQNYLGMNFASGNVGLAISSAMSLTNFLQYGMKVSANVENLMISAERSLQYTKLPSEAPLKTKETNPKIPRDDWSIMEPTVTFEQACLSYDDKNDTLDKLSFKVKAGEKIGIVGQTGAGKSSVLRALFRMTELRDGKIRLDGRDVTLLGLHDLRSKLVIIPQEPKLFKGTLHFNLDPSGQVSSNEMAAILKKIGLDKPLNMEIENHGENLAFGERQLVSIARALLLKRKIICLDEATAHIDPRTDCQIQEILRQTLDDSTTSITIAHRLSTVIESDRILVLSHGQVKEYDHPHLLLQNPTGFLTKMVRQTGAESEQDLRNRAEQSWYRKNSA